MKKSEFERIVDKTFWDLEAKHGYKKIETTYRRGGVIVRFQNATTEVALNYDIGICPWVTVADSNNLDAGSISLDWLLVELNEKKNPTPDEAFLPSKMDEGQLETQLKEKCEQLLKFGADFLKGDFTLMPALQKRAEDYLAECKRFAEQKNSKT